MALYEFYKFNETTREYFLEHIVKIFDYNSNALNLSREKQNWRLKQLQTNNSPSSNSPSSKSPSSKSPSSNSPNKNRFNGGNKKEFIKLKGGGKRLIRYGPKGGKYYMKGGNKLYIK